MIAMLKTRAFPLVAAMLAMAGCSLAPEYVRPDLSIPSHWDALPSVQSAIPPKKESNEATARLNPDETEFLSEFDPRGELLNLVAGALRHNPDIQIAALRVDEARASYRVQDAEGLPRINLGIQQTRQQFHDPNLNERYGQNIVTSGLGFSGYELDFFGRLRSLTESARHDYLATRYAQETGRVALIVETGRIYINCVAAADLAETLHGMFADEQSLLTISERQYQLGVISEEQLRNQRSVAEQARRRWERARSDQLQSAHALQLVTGYVADDSTLTGKVAELTPVAATSESRFANRSSEALIHRPDVMQAEEKLRAANADIGAARAAFFPSIQLSSSIGIASPSLHGLFSSGAGTWLFSPQISLPIFSGGSNQANLDLAHIRKNIAVLEYEKTVQNAFREVADTLTAHEQVVDQIAAESRIFENEQRTLALATKHFDAGWIDKNSLLAAKIRCGEQSLRRIDEQRALAINWLDLYRAFYGLRTTS
jgi:multidrug efflux system outer membrane protein